MPHAPCPIDGVEPKSIETAFQRLKVGAFTVATANRRGDMAAQLIEHALLHIGAAPLVLEAVAQRVEDQPLIRADDALM